MSSWAMLSTTFESRLGKGFSSARVSLASTFLLFDSPVLLLPSPVSLTALRTLGTASDSTIELKRPSSRILASAKASSVAVRFEY